MDPSEYHFLAQVVRARARVITQHMYQFLAQVADDAIGVGAGAVELVDERDARDVVPINNTSI